MFWGTLLPSNREWHFLDGFPGLVGPGSGSRGLGDPVGVAQPPLQFRIQLNDPPQHSLATLRLSWTLDQGKLL